MSETSFVTLPAEGTWDTLEPLGIHRGDTLPGYPPQVTASLPAGWIEKVDADNPEWANIIDLHGIVRAVLFRKPGRAFIGTANVPLRLANTCIWGDTPVGLPDCWRHLTDSERAAFWDEIHSYRNRLSPEIVEAYPQAQERIAAMVALTTGTAA